MSLGQVYRELANLLDSTPGVTSVERTNAPTVLHVSGYLKDVRTAVNRFMRQHEDTLTWAVTPHEGPRKLVIISLASRLPETARARRDENGFTFVNGPFRGKTVRLSTRLNAAEKRRLHALNRETTVTLEPDDWGGVFHGWRPARERELSASARVRTASNRHWEFVNETLLAPLNDQLALRHGPSYHFAVPEASFDWDVELAAVKDRSGNKIREQYLSAWVQPALVGPEETTVRQLGVRLTWDAKTNEFKQDEVTKLMRAVDGQLGSPLKERSSPAEESEAPPEPKQENTVDTQERLSAVAFRLAAEVGQPAGVSGALELLQRLVDSRQLSTDRLKQLELQSVKDDLNRFSHDVTTSGLALLLDAVAGAVASPDVKDTQLYDACSRYARVLDDAGASLGESPSNKREALGMIDSFIDQLRLSGQSGNPRFSATKTYVELPTSRVIELLSSAAKQVRELRDKLDELTGLVGEQAVVEDPRSPLF